MDIFLKELESLLIGAVSHFREEIKAVRSNRPSVEMFENIKVNYYDQLMPLKQLGSISLGSQREVQISVWDKNAVGPVSGAIQDAKLGLSLQTEGNIIRAFLPSLSSERREELVKLVKKMSEEARVQVRLHRDEIMKKIKSAEDKAELTEDQTFKGKEAVQKTVDKTNEDIQKNLDGKIMELQE